MHTIAIDCGASFVKGALFSEEGMLLEKRQADTPTMRQNGDMKEPIQISELILRVKEMLDGLVDAGGENQYKLCISNEMHGFLLADAKGNPITDYISWQKGYGSIPVDGTSVMEDLDTKENAEDILHTGMKLRNSLPSCNLYYLLKTGFFYDRSEEIYFYTLGDYILRELSGEEPWCHPTNAAATGLYDLRRENWNPKLIKAYEERKVIFPQIGYKLLSFMRKDKRIMAYPAIGDQQAALLGAGLSSMDEISFNLGTGAQVSRITDCYAPSSQYQTRPFFNGYYLMTVPHLPSGRALNVYFRFIRGILEQFGIKRSSEEIWGRILEAEKNGVETGMKADLSFFENPLTAFDRGSIGNIGEYELTMENLFHTVFMQMADNFVQVAERIDQEHAEIKKLIFSGGIARRITPIRERILERYGMDMEYTVAVDETLKGLYQYGNL